MDKRQVIEAYLLYRKIDNTIPDDVLDLMKDAAIEKLAGANWQSSTQSKGEALTFEEWDKKYPEATSNKSGEADLQGDGVQRLQNWIPISKHPENGQICILYSEDGIHLTFFKFWEVGANGNPVAYFADMNNKGPITLDENEITHWMPLPKYPDVSTPPQVQGEADVVPASTERLQGWDKGMSNEGLLDTPSQPTLFETYTREQMHTCWMEAKASFSYEIGGEFPDDELKPFNNFKDFIKSLNNGK